MNNNPSNAAVELRKSLGWEKPADFSMEEVANSLGIHIKNCNKINSEGRIVIKNNFAVVRIRENITLPSKRNFIIAHEIGHFCLHKELLILFNDTHKTLSEWYKNGPHEQEANTFASSLLMPEALFKKMIVQKKLSLGLIKDLGDFFGVSLTATYLRYVEIGKYPLMVIFIENGKVKWKKPSLDFPFTYLPHLSSVPAYTVAGDLFYHNRVEKTPIKIKAIEWFPEDYECQKESDTHLWEQCFQVSSEGIITCLWS